MVDFHTHILYGLDDGANNIGESLELINSLKNQGVKKIVLTPHFYFNNISKDGFFILRKKVLDNLESALNDKDIKLIPACEVYLSKTNLTDNLNKFNIHGTKYLMLELPHRTVLTKNIFDRINSIIDYTGLIPVIAHAERYASVLSNPEIVSQLILMGCLIQINTTSLFSKRLSKLTVKMLKMGQAHCLGTDCHNAKRPPVYQQAKEFIEKNISKEIFDRLQQNMNDILDNKIITVGKVKPIKKLFGFYI